MRNFLRFILKHHFTFLFILLEFVAFVLVVSYNQNQRALYLSSSSRIAGGLFEKVDNVEQYFALKEINQELSNENAFLRSQMPTSFRQSNDYFSMVGDSASMHQYKYRACKVVNNTVRKHFNYVTLNKGTKDGIKPDMGVLCNRGIVGIVIKCNDHYSTALSVLNPRLKVSAKLKGSDFFGSVSWDTKSILFATLDEIPEHANVSLGDQVITSGYSSTFPEGILIGTVDEVLHPDGESFYKIKVKLSTDFAKLSYVEVVENILQEQQQQLEEDTKL
ncbi:rod shape-determining protein MreC [Saccharicrinis fermentans]|uniref:Cell shape-determining protein MreC n=1 Tax=Saccharicrinis fermentans DSM 9555 = JCM 21142 TaxID=869213 RepID=W7YP94_9BACT|nr:rod shape-determining protein MreC [Saccharicrinis fermentans]GAF04209.1 rod shape-determining protein MreC [Saccharicrinis fermentans DSM 9555 = JCM 21142]